MTPSITTWVLDLPALLFSGGATTLYLLGTKRRAERGVARPWATVAFLLGIVVLLLSHLSPIAAYSEVLFWPHMVQHLLITLVAGPLIAWSTPVTTIRQALPADARHRLALVARRARRTRRRAGSPPPLLLATLASIAVLWIWHTPPVYDAAVRAPALHLLEHASFLATAVWFWSEVRSSARRHPRTQAIATLCLGLMIVQGGVLGAAITFAGRSLFEVYAGHGGLSSLEDQQLAGALMWVPPGFVYGGVAVRRFIGWFNLVGGGDPVPPEPGPVGHGPGCPPDGGERLANTPAEPPR